MEFTKPIPFQEAIDRIGERTPIGAMLTSDDWARVPVALRERKFFISTIEDAQFLQRSKDLITDFLTGARDPNTTALKVGSRAAFVEQARRFAIEQGLGPLDPADAGTIKDITSEQRQNLIFDTQTKAAYGYGGWKQGNDGAVLQEFPAQRFIRVQAVKEPRSIHRLHEGEVQLKSDIGFWTALNLDFHVPWGPWAWGCGHDVEDVDRAEATRLGLIQPGERVSNPDQSFNARLKASTANLDPDTLSWLRHQLGDKVTETDGEIRWK